MIIPMRLFRIPPGTHFRTRLSRRPGIVLRHVYTSGTVVCRVGRRGGKPVNRRSGQRLFLQPQMLVEVER